MSRINRGMLLEDMIVRTNIGYKTKGKARVDKIATPWNVRYDRRRNRVKSAYPGEKSTVDFIGLAEGVPIAFDAKETKNQTRFPLSNIKQHQVDYLKEFKKHGGEAFMIVSFVKEMRFYYLTIGDLIVWWKAWKDGSGRASIPYDWFEGNCRRIRTEHGALLNYLPVALENHKKEAGSERE